MLYLVVARAGFESSFCEFELSRVFKLRVELS